MVRLNNFALVIIVSVINLLSSNESLAKCNRYNAPDASLKFARVGPNSGVQIDGFVDLIRNGKPLKVSHGLDVSRYNAVDFRKAKECGASFVFIRVSTALSPDNRAETHWLAASEAGLKTFPYHNLHLDAIRFPRKDFPITDSVTLHNRWAESLLAGEAQAGNFLMVLEKLRKNSKNESPTIDVIGLDMEAQLPVQQERKEMARVQFAQLYLSVACTWTNRVRSTFPAAKLLIYTTPYIGSEYFSKAPEQMECLASSDIWLSYPVPFGAHFAETGSNNGKIWSRTFCLFYQLDRCVVHQYTHFGSMGIQSGKEYRTFAKSVDVNRLHEEPFSW